MTSKRAGSSEQLNFPEIMARQMRSKQDTTRPHVDPWASANFFIAAFLKELWLKGAVQTLARSQWGLKDSFESSLAVSFRDSPKLMKSLLRTIRIRSA